MEGVSSGEKLPKPLEHLLMVHPQKTVPNLFCRTFVTLKLTFPCPHLVGKSGLDQFGDTILFTTDDEILEAMSRFDETFLSEAEGPESLVYEEELQRPRTADGEGEERPFTQAGFREEDLTVSKGFSKSTHPDPKLLLVQLNVISTLTHKAYKCRRDNLYFVLS